MERYQDREISPFFPHRYDKLIEAAEALFDGRTQIPYAETIEALGLNSVGNDKEGPEQHDYTDAMHLLQDLHEAFKAIEQRTDEPKKIAVVGAGAGRLLEVYAQLVKRYNVDHITFNDLVEKNVEALRAKVQSVFGGSGDQIDGAKVNYVHGNVITEDFPAVYHLVVMNGLSSSENFDLSSPGATERLRDKLYQKMQSLLISGGVLYEDTPDIYTGSGLYLEAAINTREVLAGLNVLSESERERFLLTNWSDTEGNTNNYQLRYVPEAWREKERRSELGFEELALGYVVLPRSSSAKLQDALQIINRHPDDNTAAIADLRNSALRVSEYPVSDETTIKRITTLSRRM